jgi:hypothetical protein
VSCTCDGPRERTMFCPTCGYVYDKRELRTVADRVQPRFIGRHSFALEKFWHTGDPNDCT